MDTKIILIRHGESLGNAKGIYLGHTNWGLSEQGLLQAEAAAKGLKDIKIDAVYSSDLKRAHQTAEPHAKIRNLEVIDSENLREMNLGDWEGAAIKELSEKHYDEFVIGWKENFGNFRFPGGESVLEAASRFYKEVLRIAKLHPGKTVLIAAHAAVIRAFWCTVLKLAPEDMAKSSDFPSNASASTLLFDGESFIPLEYSNDSYLNDLKKEPIL